MDVAKARSVVAVYGGAFALAEIILAVTDSPLGVAVLAVIAVGAVHHVQTLGAPDETADRSRIALPAFLLSMALVSVSQIATFALPLSLFSAAVWPLILAVPTAVGIVAVARADAPGTWERTWFTSIHLREVAIGVAGIPLSLLGYVALRPPALIATTGAIPTALAATSLFLLAVVEETLYRGLLQRALVAMFERPGIVVAAIIATTASIGDRSLSATLLVAVLALLFGTWVERTRCLIGVSVAHALVLIGMLLVWPRVL